MASHNVSLPSDLSERVKRRQQLDGMWKLSWWVQRQLEAELSAWEAQARARGLLDADGKPAAWVTGG